VTVEAQVREAVERGKPGEALLILAREVDGLTEMISTQEPMKVEPDWSIPVDEPEPTDPDERVAWEAKRRLAKDAGRTTADLGLDRTKTSTVSVGANSFEVTVPQAPAGVSIRRSELAYELFGQDTRWWSRPELAIEGGKAHDAYVKGGPLWLHTYDRDFVVGLPRHIRVAMVQDLETHSLEDAHLLSRDILKDTDPEGNRAIALQAQGANNA
jgi:hypothetical protein